MAVSASGFVNNWQAGKTVTECNLRMLQEEDSCDVTFRCGTEGHVVKAHRYMLISRSCVFHAMLTGAMAEKSDVKIPDIEALVFKTFLKYIYTDNIDINADNVTALMYTARKYGVTSFETKCTEFLDRNLNPVNACVILEAAHHFDQKELYEKAMTIIHSKGEKSLQSSGFLALSKYLVDEIVGSDDLAADEHVIFSAVNDWSEAECVREGREVTPESKRLVLGDVLMKLYGAFSGIIKNTYNVTSYFGDEDNVLSCVVRERTEYTCEGEVFDVIFSRPVSVSAGEWYTLAVKIEGPKSWKGLEGQDELLGDDGVELRFKKSRHSTNISDVWNGQIPTLVYNLH